jgi:hypothetical protein
MSAAQTFMAGTMIATTAYSAYGNYQMGKYNQAVAENNAQVAEYQAADAIERGALEEKQHRLQVSRLKGQQRAAIASSGFIVDADTAADVTMDTTEMGERDALAIRSNAEREAWAYKVQASNARAEGQLDRMGGQYQAATSLMSGAGSVADKWYRWNKET